MSHTQEHVTHTHTGTCHTPTPTPTPTHTQTDARTHDTASCPRQCTTHLVHPQVYRFTTPAERYVCVDRVFACDTHLCAAEHGQRLPAEVRAAARRRGPLQHNMTS